LSGKQKRRGLVRSRRIYFGGGPPKRATRAVIGTSCPTDRRRASLNFRSGAEGDRTPDLCSAIAALSQLSYSPAITRRTVLELLELIRRTGSKQKPRECWAGPLFTQPSGSTPKVNTELQYRPCNSLPGLTIQPKQPATGRATKRIVTAASHQWPATDA
jgi:hypothetical protein